ncbi:50S ribosomal protein L1 [Babesia ovis]|uniref:50S ribosomal protein L1 n=1 Tax=Babesia ovis TaxID=5869 RepID=A0A9W5WUX5_BABOV|nr:50S ribosomal protein L1 [Babesia ovis]
MFIRLSWALLCVVSLLLSGPFDVYVAGVSHDTLFQPILRPSTPSFVVWVPGRAPSVDRACNRRFHFFRSSAKGSGKRVTKATKKAAFSGTLADREALIQRSLAIGIPQEDIDECLEQFVVVKGSNKSHLTEETSGNTTISVPGNTTITGDSTSSATSLSGNSTTDSGSTTDSSSTKETVKNRDLPKRLAKRREYLPEKGLEYPLLEAIDRIKLISRVRFVEGIDVSLHVPLTKKKIRATASQFARLITIPHQSLKSRRCRIGVFAKPEICDQISALNYSKVAFIGGAELIERFKAADEYPKVDFVLSDLATFHKLSAIGRTLGRRGLMPSLVVGTCIQHTEDLLEKVDQVENRNTFILRSDRAGDIKCNFADVTMPREQIRENLLEIVNYLRNNKPDFAGPQLLSAAYISSSMGPSFRLSLRDLGCRVRSKRKRK